MVGTAGEVFGMGRPDCGSTVCMERVEGCRVVLSVCFGLRGNMQLHNFIVEHEKMKGGKQVSCDTMIKWSR